jgi:hypothetical protein
VEGLDEVWDEGAVVKKRNGKAEEEEREKRRGREDEFEVESTLTPS